MATVSKRRRKTSSSQKKSGSKGSKITLPTADNRPPDSLGDSVSCFYGRKGIGKTTMASKIKRQKKTLVMMLERGRRNLRIRQVNPKNYEEVIEYVSQFIDSDVYDCMVIDTVDRLHEMVTAYVLAQAGVDSILEASNDDRPSLYREISSTFSGIMGVIQESGKGLVLLSHEQTREMENRKIKALKDLARGEGEDYDEDEGEDDAEDKSSSSKVERIQPSCSPSAFREVEQICNFVFYYGYIDRRRAITVRDPGDFVWVSSGDSEHFLDPDGEPIKTFFVANDPDQAYKDLLKAFNNEARDISYKPRKKKGGKR